MSLWNNRDGNIAVNACVTILCVLLVFSAISEYLRWQNIAENVRDAAQSAVIVVAIQNYDEVYNGLREGYAGGYELDKKGEWQSKVDNGSVLLELSNQLGLVDGEKRSKESFEYRISDLHVTVQNTKFAPEENSETFESEVELTLEIPFSFGWKSLPTKKMKLKVDSKYSAKF